ncbi:MAG: chemotaxis response regulator protein-glutamate methylesterase [Nitrospinae bacterium]|nr:chemotaxis response regulator protein-glutamate methylesterase [Nitrospinota bacterium]
MTKPTIKVLVVDDAEFLRKNLPLILESEGDIKVVGTAATGSEGVKLAKSLRPDVITLDIVMPHMNGLEALKIIMREIPTPVVMISSKTYHGAAETVEALTLGAVDFIQKPSGQVSLDIAKIRKDILRKVRLAGAAKVKRIQPASGPPCRFVKLRQELESPAQRPDKNKVKPAEEQRRGKINVIGIVASTGGPAALQTIFSALPEDYPIPICAVQHIGAEYVNHMVKRFDDVSRLRVKAAEDGEALRPGTVYFSPGKDHMTLENKKGAAQIKLSAEPSRLLYRPSGNELLWSMGANLNGEGVCGIVLTGMGDDGALGLKRIRDAGGYTIAQDEESSVVFGMPKQAIATGAAQDILPLPEIVEKMMGFG